MRALGSSTPHGFIVLAIVLGVGLMLYQMTALVLAAPSTNRQIAIALVLPVSTSDDLGVPVGYASQVFLGTLSPEAQPPPQPDAVTYRRTVAAKANSLAPIIRPASAAIAPNDPTPTDHDGDGDRRSGSRTTEKATVPTSGTTQSRDD